MPTSSGGNVSAPGAESPPPRVIQLEQTVLGRVFGHVSPGLDTAAARIWNILAALRESGLIALGDKGYHGYDETRERVITPYKGKNKPDSQKDANRAHARLRGPGERANAQLKYWRILHKVRVSPRGVGRLAKAIHVLQNYEATAG